MSMDLFTKLCAFWFTADFFAIGLFAFAGVGVRSAIHYSLQGCIESNTATGYGPFIQMFYAQTYLASNLLGCFIMSFCITNIAKISTRSVPLYKGLTTGLCGSITTLSSWMNGSVNMLFDKYWYKIIIMIVLEFWLTWAAFTMGYAAAKIVDNVIDKHSRYMAKHYEEMQPTTSSGNANPNNGVELTAQRPAVLNDDEDIRLSSKELNQLSSTRADQLDALEAMNNVNDGSAGVQAFGEEEKENNDRGVQQLELDMQPNAECESGARGLYTTVAQAGLVDVTARKTPGTSSDGTSRTTECNLSALGSRIQQYEYHIWATLLITVATVLWIILILEPQFAYFDEIKVRNIYRSVALAPLGAWTRWGLTRFPEIKALWPNMHPQTFIANITAVTFMCLLIVFGTTSWVPAINAGFNGALSTVSTFVAELHTLYLEKGPLVALRYWLATIVLSIAIIQMVRGGNAGDTS